MTILCEKPSVAEDFGKAFNAKRETGYFVAFDGKLKITYCFGHLFELAEPEFYDDKFKRWNLLDLPIIPKEYKYVEKEDAKKQIQIVSKILKNEKGKVIIATDADREGELIARVVVSKAGILDTSQYFRFWASEALTSEVIKKEIAKVKPWNCYEKLFNQAKARQHSDWLIGMNFSRLVTISSGSKNPFSVGRVQTSVLTAIYQRNYAVKNFVPIPYKTLTVEIVDDSKNKIIANLMNPKTERIDFEENDDFLQKVLRDCKNAKIEKAESKTVQKTNHPPLLLNTTGLQKLASKLFDFDAEKTLSIMQSLYEKYKCLSYPRTPSCVMGDDNVELFREKFELLKDEYPLFSKYSKVEKIDESNKRIFNSKKLDSHHALIPLKKIPENASDDEKEIFDLVVKSFFRSIMNDNIVDEKQITFYFKEYVFKATILTTVDLGWKICEKNVDEETDENIQSVSNFNEQSCFIKSVKINDKMTIPPKEYTEESILSFMENPKSKKTEERLVGLGTQTTRGTILKTLFERKYIEKRQKKLFVTEKGLYLLKVLFKNEHLKKMASISQTTEWEKQLDENPILFEKTIIEFVKNVFSQKMTVAEFDSKKIGKCPICQRNIIESKLSYSCSGYKENPSCKFSIWKNISGAMISENDVKTLLLGKKTNRKKMKSKAGKVFEAKLYLEDGEVKFDFGGK